MPAVTARLRSGVLACAAIVTLLPHAASAQRVERAVAGMRVCQYRFTPAPGQRARLAYFRVGLGEPCPATPPRSIAARGGIPSLAVLAGQSREGRILTCTYEYLGQRYALPAGPRLTCPLTPNLF